MPWHITKSGSKWKVIQDSNGHVAGTHDTEAQAKKQLAALYAGEKPGRDTGGYLTPNPEPRPVTRIRYGEGRTR